MPSGQIKTCVSSNYLKIKYVVRVGIDYIYLFFLYLLFFVMIIRLFSLHGDINLKAQQLLRYCHVLGMIGSLTAADLCSFMPQMLNFLSHGSFKPNFNRNVARTC